MNHLAHIYLSGNDENLMIGNYIADYTRGNDFSAIPQNIQAGIQLHRAIDSYTDNHAVFRMATKLVRPNLGKFAGVAMDIFFDHYLANNWSNYHRESLNQFSQNAYQLIENNWEHIPEKGRRFHTYMVAHDLLVNYQNSETLNMVFKGINSRTKFETNLNLAVATLQSNHNELEKLFETFFAELIDFVKPNHA